MEAHHHYYCARYNKIVTITIFILGYRLASNPKRCNPLTCSGINVTSVHTHKAICAFFYRQQKGMRSGNGLCSSTSESLFYALTNLLTATKLINPDFIIGKGLWLLSFRCLRSAISRPLPRRADLQFLATAKVNSITPF